jgi:hypothetical protein
VDGVYNRGVGSGGSGVIEKYDFYAAGAGVVGGVIEI